MKIKKFILGLMAFVAVAVTFTSCLGDDDDDNASWGYPTSIQRAAAFSNLTKGGTSGTATVYTSPNMNNAVDTLKTPVSWQFTSDSTIVISGVPDSLFAKMFAPTSNNDLRTALLAGSPETFTITGNIRYITYQGQVYTYLNPVSSSVSINYRDQTQTFAPMFLFNQLGIGTTDSGKLYMDMGFGGYNLNGSVITLDSYYGIIMMAN